MQHSITLLFALTVLGASAPIQAVVHGIQPLSNRYEPSSAGNRNGYRYNGPAHKYLPAASAPATEAVITTGHWVPNSLQTVQQAPYEHIFSSKPMSQQHGYKGPYNMQYYDREEQQQQQQQQLSGNTWRQQQYQQQQEQHQQLPGNSWRQEQQGDRQQQQQLSGNLYRKEQQQQLSGNSWQHQQPQKLQQLSSNSWQHESRQQHLDSQQQHPALSQHNNNNLNTFPYAGNNKFAAASTAMGQLGASYGLSAVANHNRILESDMRDNQLMTQALPEPYQQQLFASQKQQPGYEQQLGGSTNFVQMQSNSYELPASYSTQHEYPEQHYDDLRQKEMPQSGYQYAGQGLHYSQPDYYHDSSSPLTGHAQPTATSSSSSTQSSHLTFQPSREFLAPYY